MRLDGLSTLELLVRLVAVGLDARRGSCGIAAVTISPLTAVEVRRHVKGFWVDTREPRVSANAAALPWTRRCEGVK